MSEPISPAAHIARVALRVNDLDRIVAFYRDVVGLTVLDDSQLTATLGVNERPLLELTGDPEAPQRGRNETGLFHTAFRVPSRDAFADALVRVASQWQLSGASDHLVSEALYLTDPEGNGIEIYVDRPREEWERDEKGELRMDTLPLSLDEFREMGERDTAVPAGTDVGHIHLEVSSIPQSRQFYVETLGMESPVSLPAPYGESSMFVSAGGYHHHIGANTWNGRSEPPAGRGIDWFEIAVPDEAAFDAIEQRFRATDAVVTEVDDSIRVHDPDGIELRICVE